MDDPLGFFANIAQILSVIIPFVTFLVVAGVRINKKLDSIAKEQKPNGGSSFRDAVDRMSKKIDHLDQRIDSLENNLANLRGAYDEHTKQNRG